VTGPNGLRRLVVFDNHCLYRSIKERCREFRVGKIKSHSPGKLFVWTLQMRIAQVAPLAESVPPKLYGGTERVISWLTEELVNLGHEVTLFASGDSRTGATLVPVWPRALRLGRPKTDLAIPQTALMEAIAEHIAHFDVIHCHIDWLPLPLLSRLRAPS
jgi:Glycosyltransferase Family 4